MSMQTHFAPAERATAKELECEIIHITNHPIIDTLMNASYGLFAVLNNKRQILSLNRSFLDLMGIEDAERVLGLRPGEYIKCIHSEEMPGGCGTSSHCSECGAAIAQLAALDSNDAQEGCCELTVRRGNHLVNLAFQIKCCRTVIDDEPLLLMFLQDVSLMKQQAYHELQSVIETSRQIENELLESEKRFKILTDTTFEGIVISESGSIMDVNDRLAQMMGYERNELIGSGIIRYIDSTDRKRIMSNILNQSESIVEHGLVCKDGSIITVEAHGKMIEHAGKSLRLTAIRDISERKRSEELLRVSEAQFRSIFQQAAVGIAICDMHGCFIRTNERFRELVGYSDHELQSLRFSDITYLEDLEDSINIGIQLRCPNSPSVTFEKRYIRKDGVLVWTQVYLSMVRDDRDEALYSIAIVQDITQRKKTEIELLNYQCQLNALASELSLAQERERRRIAFEIHDSIVQNLSLGKIMLSNCIRTASFGKLQQVCDILDDSIRQMRSLIFDLSPPLLYEMGLVPALEELADRLGKEYGFAFNLLDNFNSPQLEETLLVVVYQSVRELLLNIVKHSQAKNVTLIAESKDGDLCLYLEDDGVGFEVESVFQKAYKQGSIGLFSVQQNLRYLAGSFEIESSAGRGTSIIIQVPLAPDTNKRGQLQ